MVRFNVFGNRIGVDRTDSGWTTYYLGNEGKYRPSDFVIPNFVAEDEIEQYLADLFHESASPENPDVKRIEQLESAAQNQKRKDNHGEVQHL